MNASDRPKREGDKRVGEGSESKGVGVVSIIILVSVFSIIILIANVFQIWSMLASNGEVNLRFEAIKN